MENHTIELSTPIVAHDEEIDAITLRKPKGGDITTCGHPMIVSRSETGETQVIVNTAVIGKLISRLAGIPKSSVDQMDIADLQEASEYIMGFFSKSPRTSETD